MVLRFAGGQNHGSKGKIEAKGIFSLTVGRKDRVLATPRYHWGALRRLRELLRRKLEQVVQVRMGRSHQRPQNCPGLGRPHGHKSRTGAQIH